MTQTMQTQPQTSEHEFSDAELDSRTKFDRSRPLERDESTNLISSDRVDGTKVFSTSGDELGHIDHVMLGKISGRVEYTVMSFGGFLGLGESFFPVPWDALDYDTERGGYVVNIDKSLLKEAPRFDRDDRREFDEQFGRQIHSYYGVIY